MATHLRMSMRPLLCTPILTSRIRTASFHVHRCYSRLLLPSPVATSARLASVNAHSNTAVTRRHLSKPVVAPTSIIPSQANQAPTRLTHSHRDNVETTYQALIQQPHSWVTRMPKPIQPYLRLIRIDSPSGTWLLYLPCTFSITMASYASPDTITLTQTLTMLSLFGIGALVMRGSGCIINDLWDRDIDRKVERTKIRPLASGDISPTAAVGFLAANLTAGLMVLLQLNWQSIALGVSSLVLVAAYPLMKRITYWPQAVLGLTFNWGALLGFTAMLDVTTISCTSIASVALPLYVSGICWTLVYDTIYALQDRQDDTAAGVKSTALYFSNNFKPWITLFAVLSVLSLATAGYMNHQSWVFYTVSVGGAAMHYAWQIITLDVASKRDAFAKFASNRVLGGIVFTGLFLDLVLSRV